MIKKFFFLFVAAVSSLLIGYQVSNAIAQTNCAPYEYLVPGENYCYQACAPYEVYQAPNRCYEPAVPVPYRVAENKICEPHEASVTRDGEVRCYKGCDRGERYSSITDKDSPKCVPLAPSTVKLPVIPSIQLGDTSSWLKWQEAWAFNKAAECQKKYPTDKAAQDKCIKEVIDQVNAFRKQEDFFASLEGILRQTDPGQGALFGSVIPAPIGAKIEVSEGATLVKDLSIEANWGSTPAPIAVGSEIGDGDTIIVGDKGRIVIRYPGGQAITLPEFTKLTVKKAANGADIIYLGGGQAVIRRDGGVGDGKDFIVGTPSAVAIPDGTTYIVSYDDKTGQTKVAVLEGSVKVIPANVSIQPITLSANQELSVNKSAVTPIVPLSEDSKKLFKAAVAEGISTVAVRTFVIFSVLLIAWLGIRIFRSRQ